MSRMEGTFQPRTYHAVVPRRISFSIICVAIILMALVMPSFGFAITLLYSAVVECAIVTMVIIGGVSVVASTHGIKVRNYFQEFDIPWASIACFDARPPAVRLGDGRRLPLLAIRQTLRGDYSPPNQAFNELEQCRLAQSGSVVNANKGDVTKHLVRLSVWEWLIIAIPPLWAIVFIFLNR